MGFPQLCRNVSLAEHRVAFLTRFQQQRPIAILRRVDGLRGEQLHAEMEPVEHQSGAILERPATGHRFFDGAVGLLLVVVVHARLERNLAVADYWRCILQLFMQGVRDGIELAEYGPLAETGLEWRNRLSGVLRRRLLLKRVLIAPRTGAEGQCGNASDSRENAGLRVASPNKVAVEDASNQIQALRSGYALHAGHRIRPGFSA